MTDPISLQISEFDPDAIGTFQGVISVPIGKSGALGAQGAALDEMVGGVLSKAMKSKGFEACKKGGEVTISFPPGVEAEKISIVKMTGKKKTARKAGAKLGVHALKNDILVLGEDDPIAAELIYGLKLRAYNFDRHRTTSDQTTHKVTVMSASAKALTAEIEPLLAISEGVHFTRDLTNEPANVLSTVEFASRLSELKSSGLDIEILEEKDMEKLGMGALLGVGLGSETPSKIVIMSWNGGGKEAPLALVGKGVVFDTGGISMKPAGGMEAMTMDMGGAGVVAGVMKAIALRKAKANVIGVVGLVENMPDGRAQRPGDVVTSMKGDTIEVINTDAEGRLVLCDALWYVQERFKPSGIIDLATLTGAAVVALGHYNAAAYSNKSGFASKFLKSARKEGEGVWRMPLGKDYDALLKSPIADMKNVGGRAAGSITAAQFIARFIKPDMPWIHLDIAGVASMGEPSAFAPKGATGWGVRALNRMISDYYE